MTPQIYQHDPQRKYNTFLRNTLIDKKIEKLLSDKHNGTIRLLSIWGAKFDKDRVDYHLGHIYVIQKLQDLLQEPGLRLHIYIGINPSLEFTDHERKQRQDAYINCTTQLLKRTLLDNERSRVTINNCGAIEFLSESDRLNHNLTKELYVKIIDDLNRVYTPEIAKRLASKPEEIVRSEIEDRLRSVFGVAAELAASLYDDFAAFYQHGKHWLLNATEQALRIQILTYAHTVARPDAIVVSTRHERHWRCYRALFRLASLSPLPDLMLLDTVVSPNENEIMRSGTINSTIFVMDKPQEVRDKLEEATASYDRFLPQCFNYIILPRKEQVPSVAPPGLPSAAIQASWDLQRYKAQHVDRYLLATCQRELPLILAEYKHLVTSARKMHDSSHTQWLTLTHSAVIERIFSWLGLSLDAEFIDAGERLNQNPEAYTGFYWNTIGSICERIEKTVKHFDESPHSLIDTVRLIRQLRNMDFYIWLTEKKYRDHYSHFVNVGGCGQILLDLRFSEEKSFRDTVAEACRETACSSDSDSITATWWLTALLHDHAYPIAHFLKYLAPRIGIIRSKLTGDTTRRELHMWQQIGDSLGRMITSIAGGRLRTLLEQLPQINFATVQDYRNHIVEALAPVVVEQTKVPLNGLEPRMLWETCVDHGVLAAVNIFELTGARSRINQPLARWLPIDFVADAISVHNHPLLRPKLRFGENPYAFLLILADEIQEWGRNSFSDDEYIHPVTEVKLGPLFSVGNDELALVARELVARYVLAGSEVRQRMSWSLDLFERGKKRAFDRLYFPIFPQGASMGLDSVRYEIEADGMAFSGTGGE